MKTLTRLQNRLVLHRFVCREFGYKDMDAMLARLGEVPTGGEDIGSESGYARALALYVNPNFCRVTADRRAEYDANIGAHSRPVRLLRRIALRCRCRMATTRRVAHRPRR